MASLPEFLDLMTQRLISEAGFPVSPRIVLTPLEQAPAMSDTTATLIPPTIARDEFTAEVVAEIRDLLTRLKKETEARPVISAEWTEGQSNILDDLQSVQAAAALALMGTGQAMTIPPGMEMQHVPGQLPAALDRLAYLLGLSPAERAFVQEAADANHSGDPVGVDTTLAIFADWLEDEGRTADGMRMRRLLLEDGDVLELHGPNLHPPGPENMRKFMDELVIAIRQKGKAVVGAVTFGNQGLDRLDREQMRQAGWIREEYLPGEWEALKAEVKGQPEGSIILATDAVLKLVRRLKQENTSLREQVERLEQENACLLEPIKSVERPISSLLLSQIP